MRYVSLPFYYLNNSDAYNQLIDIFSIDTLFNYGCLYYGLEASWPYVDARTRERMYADIFEELYECDIGQTLEQVTAATDYYESQFILFGTTLRYFFESTGRCEFQFCGCVTHHVCFKVTPL